MRTMCSYMSTHILKKTAHFQICVYWHIHHTFPECKHMLLFLNLTIENADVVMLSIKNMEGKQMEGNEGHLEVVQQ